MAAGNAEDTRWTACHGGDDHGTTGQQVDVSSESARLVNGDDPLAIRRITNLDLARFHNNQIDIRLTGPKDGLAIRVIARDRQRPDEREFRAGQLGKCHFLDLNHGFFQLGRTDGSSTIQFLQSRIHRDLGTPRHNSRIKSEDVLRWIRSLEAPPSERYTG